jgi:serine phosphatase RsbU (regulator of sigma subunit)
LVLRGGTHVVEVGGTPSLPLGLGDVPSELAEVDLEPGDQVLFFTDGVVEARSDDGELFGRHRLGDLLVKSGADALPIAETVRRLCHAALAWGGPDIRDDATLVLLEWRGPRASRHLSWGPTSGGAASDGA